MRYVDLSELVMPPDWLVRAGDAAKKVAAGDDPDDYGEVWRELKDGLGALLSDKKCWYCESIVDRADNAVDHFRPKNRVADTNPPHKGYRWLAFDYMNYRYSCLFCNSRRKGVAGKTVGGKADLFPLLDESKRVYAVGSIDAEKPALLDPCDLDDWELLGCKRENGESCPASSKKEEKERALVSIEIYHLQYQPTCLLRHKTAVQLLADVADAKRLFLASTLDASRREDFLVFARKIKRAIDRKGAFSGEMIFLLRGQRHVDHPWIQRLLET